jgi:release factor glutamine methyltransferase
MPSPSGRTRATQLSFASAAEDGEIVGRLRAAGCVFAEEEASMLTSVACTAAELEAMVGRRVLGEPIEYILGWAYFCGLRIAVDAGVFVPRRRTEFLVEQAVALSAPHPVIVDLCCGSGAVGAALATAIGEVALFAVDIDPVAVRCAAGNLAAVGEVLEGDLYEPLPDCLRGRVDLVVVNAPYVPTDEIPFMPPEARCHEARVALDGGADGLDVQRRVIADALRWLTADGHLLIETSRRQAPHTAEAFAAKGFSPQIVHSEDLDATVVIGG